MQITLTVIEGPDRGRVFTFREHDMFIVGRSPDVHFSLPDDSYFSRVHFLIEFNPPLCRIMDLRSRNGTKVNGDKVTSADLRDGDLIEGGKTRLKVALDSTPVPVSSPSPPAARPDIPPSPPPTTRVLSDEAGTAPAGEAILAQGLAESNKHSFPSVPGYRIEQELGRGGMGVVYRATHEADNTTVALKTVLPRIKGSEQAMARFLREAEILRALSHPHIVAFREMGRAGDLLYFAMELVPGASADALLRQHGAPLPVARAVQLICEILEALAYAHGRGFVHRDIKPGNILVTATGEIAKLADFGLARTYQASQLSGLTMTGRAGGTAGFMPPEQVLDFRSVRPPADQYAAAATLYNLLTARPLFDGTATTADLFVKILQTDPVPLCDVSRRPEAPAGLAAAVHRALARKPEQRFADVTQFRQALLPFAGP